MKEKNKISLVVVGILIVVLGISSCTLASPTSTKLIVWKPSWGVDDIYLPPVLKKFEQANPGVTIKYDFHPWEGIIERYMAAFVGGNPPDIMYLPDEYWPMYAEHGFLAKLDELFPTELPSVKRQFEEKWWEFTKYKGHVYGIPYVHVSAPMVYNRDIFDNAGMSYPPSMDDPEFANWTWDKFIEITKKLTRPEENQWGYAWSVMGFVPHVWINPHIWQAGADLINSEGTAVGFDNEAGLRAFKFMNDLVNRYNVCPDKGMNPDFREVFYEGRAAITQLDCYMIGALPKDHPELRVGIVPHPQGPGVYFLEGRGQHGNVGFWLMSEACKSKDVAFKLMQWLDTKENSEAYINSVFLYGCRKDFELNIKNRKIQELMQITLRTKKFARGFPLHPKLQEVMSIVVAEVQNMIQGFKTPEQALRDAADKGNLAIAR